MCVRWKNRVNYDFETATGDVKLNLARWERDCSIVCSLITNYHGTGLPFVAYSSENNKMKLSQDERQTVLCVITSLMITVNK